MATTADQMLTCLVADWQHVDLSMTGASTAYVNKIGLVLTRSTSRVIL